MNREEQVKASRIYQEYREQSRETERQLNQIRRKFIDGLLEMMLKSLNRQGAFSHLSKIVHKIGPDQSYHYNDECYRASPNDIDMYDLGGEYIDLDHLAYGDIFEIHDLIAGEFDGQEITLKDMIGRGTIVLTQNSYQVEFEE